MAASTAGMLQLKNQATGKLRIEHFTMTPTDGQKVTFGGTGTTFVLTQPEGEDIVDIFFNNDGVTTVNNFKLLVNGVAINVNPLMVLFAADSNITQRLVSPIGISGNKQLQLSVHA
jgi:hypothetical protein